MDKTLIVTALAVALFPFAGLRADNNQCPFPVNVQLTCESDAPPCKHTIIVRNCGPTQGFNQCCNPALTEEMCCGDFVDLAGGSGTPCPVTGSKDCKYGLVVESGGRLIMACAGSQIGYLSRRVTPKR